MIRPADVARYLNADPSLVARWVRRGMPLTSMSEALTWHSATITPRRRLETPPPAELAAEPAPSGSMSSQLLAARLRRERAEAEMRERDAATQAGELVRRADVQRAAFEISRELRDRLAGCARRIASEVAAIATAEGCEAVIDREHRILLELLVSGTREKLGTEVKPT
jgi:phage terminase Nu1 subunit (DNA packaging protein)